MGDEVSTVYANENTHGWKRLYKLLPKYELGDTTLGLLAKRHFNAAQGHFERALAANELGWESWWGMGKLARMDGRLQVGFENLQRALALKGNGLEFYIDLTTFALELGQYSLAEQYGRTAVEYNPKDSELLSLYAVALAMNKKSKRALGVATNACKYDANNSRTWSVLDLVKRIDRGEEEIPESIRF